MNEAGIGKECLIGNLVISGGVDCLSEEDLNIVDHFVNNYDIKGITICDCCEVSEDAADLFGKILKKSISDMFSISIESDILESSFVKEIVAALNPDSKLRRFGLAGASLSEEDLRAVIQKLSENCSKNLEDVSFTIDSLAAAEDLEKFIENTKTIKKCFINGSGDSVPNDDVAEVDRRINDMLVNRGIESLAIEGTPDGAVGDPALQLRQSGSVLGGF